MTQMLLLVAATTCVMPPALALEWKDSSSAIQRKLRAQEFHARSQQRTGVLLPMYVYPSDIHKNVAYNRLIEIKRRYETVPIWVILNPDSGPGQQVDPNYTKAIDRLEGAGCVVLGYVSTRYGKRASVEVRTDVDQWLKLYPRIHGIFFDEMIYEDTASGTAYQSDLNRYAHDAGCWPTVANPGAPTPGRYFASDASDVIVVSEGDHWPTEENLKGDYFGGYADYPPFMRGILLHSQTSCDTRSLKMARQYVRWLYVTERPYRAGDPQAANPWNGLSKYLEEICIELGGSPETTGRIP